MTRPFFSDRHPARPDRQGGRGMTARVTEASIKRALAAAVAGLEW
jgi:hypothetical protein